MAATILRDQALAAIHQVLSAYRSEKWSGELMEKLCQGIYSTCVDLSKELLTTEEALNQLHRAGIPIPERTIRYWAKKGVLKADREGSRPVIKFNRSSVEEYIAKHQAQAELSIRAQVICATWTESLPTVREKMALLTALAETPYAQEHKIKLNDTEGTWPATFSQEFRTNIR